MLERREWRFRQGNEMGMMGSCVCVCVCVCVSRGLTEHTDREGVPRVGLKRSENRAKSKNSVRACVCVCVCVQCVVDWGAMEAACCVLSRAGTHLVPTPRVSVHTHTHAHTHTHELQLWARTDTHARTRCCEPSTACRQTRERGVTGRCAMCVCVCVCVCVQRSVRWVCVL